MKKIISVLMVLGILFLSSCSNPFQKKEEVKEKPQIEQKVNTNSWKLKENKNLSGSLSDTGSELPVELEQEITEILNLELDETGALEENLKELNMEELEGEKQDDIKSIDDIGDSLNNVDDLEPKEEIKETAKERLKRLKKERLENK